MSGGGDCWPDDLRAQFRNISVAICRSRPAAGERAPIREIETTYLALIARGPTTSTPKASIFASRRIAEAVARRLDEPEGPEIVLINRFQVTWLARADCHGYSPGPALRGAASARSIWALPVYHPFTERGEPIYVHAKMTIVDDEVLHVGSSNMNNRSLRLDTECDITIDARLSRQRGRLVEDPRVPRQPAGRTSRPPARGRRRDGDRQRLPDRGHRTLRLRNTGRSTRPYQIPDLRTSRKWLADNQVPRPRRGPEEGNLRSNGQKGGLLRSLRRRLGARAFQSTTASLNVARRQCPINTSTASIADPRGRRCGEAALPSSAASCGADRPGGRSRNPTIMQVRDVEGHARGEGRGVASSSDRNEGRRLEPAADGHAAHRCEQRQRDAPAARLRTTSEDRGSPA